ARSVLRQVRLDLRVRHVLAVTFRLEPFGIITSQSVLGGLQLRLWPDRKTILAWYRKLVARKFDCSKARRNSGRPRIKRGVEQLFAAHAVSTVIAWAPPSVAFVRRFLRSR